MVRLVGIEPRQVAAGRHMPFGISKLERGLETLEPVFCLSLYSDRFFGVKTLLACEPGWQAARWDFTIDSSANSEPYEILDAEWARFEGFTRFFTEARSRCSGWQPIERAKRYYLHATFARPDALAAFAHRPSMDDNPAHLAWDEFPPAYLENDVQLYEETLLRYIFVIESLLRLPQEKRRLSIQRAKSFAGRNESEENWIDDFLNEAYKLRHKLAHEALEPEPKECNLDIRKLRRLCQRIICLTLMLFCDHPDKNQVTELLRQMGVSPKANEAAKIAHDKVFGLIQDSSELSGEYLATRFNSIPLT